MFQPTLKVLFVLVVMAFSSSYTAHAAGRYALVIGNSAYTGSPSLKNPKNDADLIAKTLSQVGFEVIKVTDATQRQMRRAMLDFSRILRNNKGSVGLFYYAGHGVQVRGINYMVPVTADIKDEEEVRIEGVDVNDFLSTMRNSNSRLNIIILDACRNNPYQASNRSASRGLAPVQAASGTLIAYSTAPGDVAFDGDGLNSPYTLALSRFMRKPGLSVETVFKRVLGSVEDATQKQQTPWLTGAFRGEFYFLERGNQSSPQLAASNETSGAASGSTTRGQSSGQSLEKLFWESIVNSKNPASFQAYISAFPSGTFSTLAKLKISELEKANKNIVVAAKPPSNSNDQKPDRKSERTLPTDPFSSIFKSGPPQRKTRVGKSPPVQAKRSLFPNSSTTTLKRSDVNKLSCHKLWLARNEIYHRNGYCFKSEKGIRYFNNSNCTKTVVKLSSLEQRNKRTIRTWEIRKRCRLKQAKRRVRRK